MGLHQDPKASSCPVETTGSLIGHLYRQHFDPGRVQGAGLGPCHRPGVPAGESRLCSEQSQASAGTIANHRVSRSHGQFAQPGNESTHRQDPKDQSRDMITVREQAGVTMKAITTPGKATG